MLCLVQMGRGRTGVVAAYHLLRTVGERARCMHPIHCGGSTLRGRRAPHGQQTAALGQWGSGDRLFQTHGVTQPIPFGCGLGRAPRVGPAAPHAVALRGLRCAAVCRCHGCLINSLDASAPKLSHHRRADSWANEAL